MTTDLSRRLARLEALGIAAKGEKRTAQAQHARRMAGLHDFIDVAWPGRKLSLADHVAAIFGLPDAPALRRMIEGEKLEDVARARYGAAWRERMETAAEEAAAVCQAAHGPGWAERFAAIWRGEAT